MSQRDTERGLRVLVNQARHRILNEAYPQPDPTGRVKTEVEKLKEIRKERAKLDSQYNAIAKRLQALGWNLTHSGGLEYAKGIKEWRKERERRVALVEAMEGYEIPVLLANLKLSKPDQHEPLLREFRDKLDAI